MSISFELDTSRDVFITCEWKGIPLDSKIESTIAEHIECSKGLHKVQLKPKLRRLNSVSLAFTFKPGVTIRLQNIYFEGKRTLQPSTKNVIAMGWDTLELSDNEIEAYSTDSAASFNFNPKCGALPLHAAYDIDILILTTVLVFGFFAAYKLSRYILYKTRSSIVSPADIVLICTFFFLCFLPMSNISDKTISILENRALAPKPDVGHLFDKNYKYASKYESWFNDHFYGRDMLIQFHEEMNRYLSGPARGNRDVHVGLENWFFFKRETDFSNSTEYDIHEMKRAAEYLVEIDTWCKANGKKFYYLICPDKDRIYGEFYADTKKKRPDSQSRTERFISYLREHTDISVIYPAQRLLSEKDKGLLYYKHDTHWTLLGAYIAYQSLMDEICKTKEIRVSAPVIVSDSPVPPIEHNLLGGGDALRNDLERLLPGSVADDTKNYPRLIFADNQKTIKIQDNRKPLENEQSLSKYDSDYTCVNPSGKYALFLLRDSFATALAPYLNDTFREARYLWRYRISAKDLQYIKEHSDIVVLEQIERRVSYIFNHRFPE